ncbi:transposase [Vibrio mimicus]
MGAYFSVNGISHSTHSHSTRQSVHTSPKNDANDALAICETALRPGIHFVAIKTIEQQDMKALRSARQLMVELRTALTNQACSLAAEQGIEIPVGIHILQQRLPDIIEDAEQLISPVLRQLLFSLLENGFVAEIE